MRGCAASIAACRCPYFHTDGGRSLLRLPYLDPHAEHADVDVNALLAAAHTRLATRFGESR